MKRHLIYLITLIRDFFFPKKPVLPRMPQSKPRRWIVAEIPNHHHFPSLGIHRIRDTP